MGIVKEVAVDIEYLRASGSIRSDQRPSGTGT